MINTGFDKAKGQAVLASGEADLIPHLSIEQSFTRPKRARSPKQWEADPIRFVQSQLGAS